MSDRILQYWILKFGPFLEYEGAIQAHEFLYLLSNTFNKEDIVSRLL